MGIGFSRVRVTRWQAEKRQMNSDSADISPPRYSRAEGGYLPTLDGWRAVAIVLVLMCHGGLYYFSPHGPHPSGRLQTYASRGWIGVDIFFAISGFLICTRLLREQQKTGAISLRSFYLRRAFRILPPYLLYLAVISLLAAFGWIIVQKQEIVASLLFVRNYLPAVKTKDIGWFTGHFWSLAVEEHFYLLWPTLLLALKPRRANMAAIGLIIAITIWRTIDLHFALFFPNAGHIFDHRTDTRLDSLLWGCVFAIAFVSEAGRQWLKKWINPFAWFITVFALIVLTKYANAVADALRPPLFAAIVAATVVHPQWLVGRILEDPRLRWIGRISYSLYIWQQLFLVGDLIPRPLPFGHWQEVPLSFVLILLCATASYYLVERPLLGLGHRLTRAHASSSIPSSSSIAVIASAGPST